MLQVQSAGDDGDADMRTRVYLGLNGLTVRFSTGVLHALWEPCVEVYTSVQHVRTLVCDVQGPTAMRQFGLLLRPVSLSGCPISAYPACPSLIMTRIHDVWTTWRTSGIGKMKPHCSGTLGTLSPENLYDEVAAHSAEDVFVIGAMLIFIMARRSLYRHNMFAHEVRLCTVSFRERGDNWLSASCYRLSAGGIYSSSAEYCLRIAKSRRHRGLSVCVEL